MRTAKRERRQTIVIGPGKYNGSQRVFVKSFRYSSSSSVSDGCSLAGDQMPDSPTTLFEALPILHDGSEHYHNRSHSSSSQGSSWRSSLTTTTPQTPADIEQELEIPSILPRKPSHFYRCPPTPPKTPTEIYLPPELSIPGSMLAQRLSHQRVEENVNEDTAAGLQSSISSSLLPSLEPPLDVDTTIVAKKPSIAANDIKTSSTSAPMTPTDTNTIPNGTNKHHRAQREQQLNAALDSIAHARSLLNDLSTILPWSPKDYFTHSPGTLRNFFFFFFVGIRQLPCLLATHCTSITANLTAPRPT